MKPLLASIVLVLAAAGPARAELAREALVHAGERAFPIRVTTLKDLRQRESFRTTIRQQFDFSCGSAALATLLTHHYDRPAGEARIFELMYEAGDRERIRSEGFSLLDMKRFLERVGYEADGFEVSIDELAAAKVPAIALIRDNGYNHFVVVKGILGNRILLGDPSSGTRIVTRGEFEALWQVKIFFVIRSHVDIAKFNQPAEWAYRLRVPIGDALMRDSAAGTLLMRPGPNDF